MQMCREGLPLLRERFKKYPVWSFHWRILILLPTQNQLHAYVDNWSKVGEYPWLWFNGFGTIEWQGKRSLDAVSEESPMPWFIMSGFEVRCRGIK